VAVDSFRTSANWPLGRAPDRRGDPAFSFVRFVVFLSPAKTGTRRPEIFSEKELTISGGCAFLALRFTMLVAKHSTAIGRGN
jgi:hypothetical protein